MDKSTYFEAWFESDRDLIFPAISFKLSSSTFTDVHFCVRKKFTTICLTKTANFALLKKLFELSGIL